MRTTRYLFLLGMSLAIFSMVVGSALAVQPPDNATKESASMSTRIKASMSNVDDVGLVIVWNGNGATTAAQCEWVGGQHGAANVVLDGKYLTKGTNFVIFVLYNKVYEGFGPFAGGKWSGDMRLTVDDSTFWSVSKNVRENDKEIKYWKVIQVDVDSSGKATLTENIPDEAMEVLKKAMYELEDKLNESAGIATPF